MRAIQNNVFSYLASNSAGAYCTVEEIAGAKPRAEKSYGELAEAAAEIAYKNRKYFPLYRTGGDNTNLTVKTKKKRMADLENGKALLLDKILQGRNKIFNKKDFEYFDELAWSLFQQRQNIRSVGN
jgi:hypothetical protein